MSHLLQTEPPVTRRLWARYSAIPLWQVLILVTLTLWVYAPTLYRLVMNWGDKNYSHGFFVPLFSAYVVWQQRERLAALPLRPSSTGLLLIAFALCVLIVGQLGAEIFLSRLSLIVLLAGFIVLQLGWNYFRALLFPLAFLLLMIPIPALIFNQITLPLQFLASRLAANVLWYGCNVPVLRAGNVLHLAAMPLEVAEACSGIRSLISLTTLAIIYGYLMEPRIIVRVVLALAAVPIAVAANGLRIVGTGLLVQYWSTEAAEGFFHTFSSWLVFVVTLLMLYVFHQLLRLIWRDKNNEVKKTERLQPA